MERATVNTTRGAGMIGRSLPEPMPAGTPSTAEVTPGGTARAIEDAALEAFYENGYHGASVRAIASSAGVGIATLFHHFPSKAAILVHILNQAVDAMQADLDAATAGLTDPVLRLSAAIRALVIAHCERKVWSFVAQSELRSVPPSADEAIRQKRRTVQRVFDDALLDGCATGQFDCEAPREAARAIVSMGTQVASWYRAGADLSPDEVAGIYVEMGLRLAGTDERRDTRGASGGVPGTRALQARSTDARPRILLGDVAHARSGDKSGSVNIGVIVTRRKDMKRIAEALTPSRIRRVLGLPSTQIVKIYPLPALAAFNIVLPDALGGAPTDTLAADVFGHSFGQRILALEIHA
jgi:AcrR family transcriptional regulator